jgi:hypothetical protein
VVIAAAQPDTSKPTPVQAVATPDPTPALVASATPVAPAAAPAKPLQLRKGDLSEASRRSVAAYDPSQPPATGAAPEQEVAMVTDEDSAPATTASVDAVQSSANNAAPAADEALPLPAAGDPDSAVSSVDAPPSDRTAGSDSSVWSEASAACPRDWVGAGSNASTGCAASAALVASVAPDDQSALEQAAEDRAEVLGMLMPRIPEPRPDVVPKIKRVRVARASGSGWPAGPPPRCAAGKRAKWRFVERGSSTKEWYCR